MTQYKITAPVAGFSGEVAGVVFSQGQALVTVNPDDRGPEGATSLPKSRVALTYFQRKGYSIEPVEKPEDAQLDATAAAPGTPAATAVDPAQVPGSGVQTAVPQQTVTEPSTTGSAAKLPAKSASKADWVSYATEHGGMTANDADAMTRDDLAAKYHKEASQ